MNPPGQHKRSQTGVRTSITAGEGDGEGDEDVEDGVRLCQRSFRSITSQRSSSIISETTRNNLLIRYRHRCWLCGLRGTDTSHVYPEASEALVSKNPTYLLYVQTVLLLS
jgi:hypothetical protein